MLYRPSTLDDSARQAVRDHAEACRKRMLDHTETLLTGMPPAAAQLVYDLAFSTSEALPKRDRRPKIDTVVLIEAVTDDLDVSETERDALVRLTIVAQEYFDMVDDLLDDDVAPGRRADVLQSSQLLVPLMVRQLGHLGAAPTTYWCRSAEDLMCAPLTESETEPTATAYRDLLDRQSQLYSAYTGIAGVAADCSEERIDRLETIGSALYCHRQLVLDTEQYHEGDGDPWNGRRLLGEDGVETALGEYRTIVEDQSQALASDAGRRIRSLVALDVEAWRATLRER